MEEAFDLDELAGRYRMFLDRWDGARAASRPTPSRNNRRLSIQWLLLVRRDPAFRSPSFRDRPAGRAEAIHWRRLRSLRAPAGAIARDLIEAVRVVH